MNTIKIPFKVIILITFLLIKISLVQAQSVSNDAVKKNITPISSPLKNILKLQPGIIDYDTDKFKRIRTKEGRQFGFQAENMHHVFPSLVNTKTYPYMYGKNSYRNEQIQTVDEAGLIPVLVASIQELHYEMEQLRMEVTELKKNITARNL